MEEEFVLFAPPWVLVPQVSVEQGIAGPVLRQPIVKVWATSDLGKASLIFSDQDLAERYLAALGVTSFVAATFDDWAGLLTHLEAVKVYGGVAVALDQTHGHESARIVEITRAIDHVRRKVGY